MNSWRAWLPLAGTLALGVAIVQTCRAQASAERAERQFEAMSQAMAERADHSQAARGDDARPQHPSHEERAALYDRAFLQQTVDAAWGPATSERVARSLRARLPSTAQVSSLECREWICRVELAVEAAAERRSLSRTLIESPDWDGPRSYFEGTDGSGKPVLRGYMVRQGHSVDPGDLTPAPRLPAP